MLATIVQLDPIYVNFTASERDVLQVRADLAAPRRTTADLLGLPVEIGLQTETGYPHEGKLDYVAPTVDPSTGTLAGARDPAERRPRSAARLFRARAHSRRSRSRRCWCPMSRSAAIRAGAMCSSSTRTTSSSSARSSRVSSVGDLRVIERGLTKDDRVVVGGIMRAIPGQKVDAELRTPRQRTRADASRRMISKFFIERPVLANVLAILMVLIGARRALSACRSRNIPTWCRRPCR